MSLFFSYIKKNFVTILLVLAAILALFVVVLTFWLKIKGFKMSHLLSLLAIAEAKNEISHLETKKAVLKTKYQYKESEIEELDKKIKEEQKKAEKLKLEMKGLSNEEIADHFNNLGY